MMPVQLNFNANNVAPDTGFEVVEAGWYNALIDSSDRKPTKDGQNSYLELRYTIVDGKHANSKLFLRLNLWNSNEKAADIASRQLSAICHAIGVMEVPTSAVLHGIPHKIKVTVSPERKDETTGTVYEPRNEIKGWKNINDNAGASVGVPAGFAQPQATQQQAAPQGWGQQAAPQPAQQPMQQQQAPQQPWAQPAPVQQPAPQPAAQGGGWAAPAAPAPVLPAPVGSQPPWAQAAPQQAPAAPVAATMPANQAQPPWAQR